MKKVLTRGLGMLARAVIKKYRPRIVAITGSVGKTTTRAACVAVLETRFRVRGSAKNYNNELGVPLTVFDMDAPGSNLFAWGAVYWKGVLQLLVSDPLFPQVLVLEMGADHPGDIAYLMSIAAPDVSVVTAVSAAHTEFMGSVEGVLKEKKTLVVGIGSDKTAIYNSDDEMITSITGEISARTIAYGFSSSAAVRGKEVSVRFDEDGLPVGMEAQIIFDGSEAEIFVPRVLGRPAVYAALAGAAVGRAFGLDLFEIQNGLQAFAPPEGRMRIIEGVKDTILIDDTYNSSPRAATEAIGIVSTLSAARRRIAVLGDMLELGALTESAHRDIGNQVALAAFDMLITVGAASVFIAEQARESGMSDSQVFSFDRAEEAGLFLQDRIESGDVILVKGSQGVRCEKVVKELMRDPLRAEELLVRQSKAWV